MFFTAWDIKCVLEKEEIINDQWKTRTGLESVEERFDASSDSKSLLPTWASSGETILEHSADICQTANSKLTVQL